jgi:Ricin-type beta-trefoil lectin domain/Lysozyme like domain
MLIPSRRSILGSAMAAAAIAAAAIVTVPLLASASPAGTGSGPVTAKRLAIPGLISPVSLPGPVSAAVAGKATTSCLRFATRAGWPDNGYFGGALVTATAICVAESRGNSGFYVCDNSSGSIIGQGTVSPGHPVKCPAGTVSYDRGLWQLNNKTASSVSDKCAFNAGCNAEQAYLFSQRGTTFTPWSSYDQDTYATFIDDAQAAINGTHLGTVTSAELGECLAVAKAAGGAKLIIVNCGDGAATQQWISASGKLKLGSHCAAITSRTAAKSLVELGHCANAKNQDWAVFGRFELRNAADGKCLTDPGGSLKMGTAVDVVTCTNAKPQTWWLP